MARTLHVHPNVLDFWLIAVYCEFDMRGNMQGSRKILLQGIRKNPGMSEFYYEYIKYELRVLEKLHTRKTVLEKSEAIKVIEEGEGDEKEESKISESVPSIVYATSSQSITTQFTYDVSLHFRILELAKKFEKNIDVSQLLSHVKKHIKNVLYVERKSEVLQYLLSKKTTWEEVEIVVGDFLENTSADLESMQTLIDYIKPFEASSKNKFEIVYKFYKSLSTQEGISRVTVEQLAILLLEFIDRLNVSKGFNIAKTLEDLHEKCPESFPILVHFCKHSLMKDDYEESMVMKHREHLAMLSQAIKEKQSQTLCK